VSPNQQCQSTEGKISHNSMDLLIPTLSPEQSNIKNDITKSSQSEDDNNGSLTSVTNVPDRRWRKKQNTFAEQRKLPQDQHLMPEEPHKECEALTWMSYLHQ